MKKWKILCLFMIFLYTLDLIGLPFQDEIIVYDFASLFFGGLGLIHFYGFAYQVAIGNKPIAIIIFLINSAVSAFALLFGITLLLGGFSIWQLVIMFIVLVILGILLYPQFMYAFKSQHIWSKNA